jgi:hypothetical protein
MRTDNAVQEDLLIKIRVLDESRSKKGNDRLNSL